MHVCTQESTEDREAALKFGLMSDDEVEWQHRHRQLQAYASRHAGLLSPANVI